MPGDTITNERELVQAFHSLWENLDDKLEAMRENFKRDALRDIMELVLHNRDADTEPLYFQNWFKERMGEAAGVMARTDLWLGETQQQCLTELWEMLAEEIGDFVPAGERHAWFAQATDGWIEFDPGLVSKAA